MTQVSKEIFQGRIIRLTQEQVTLPNGQAMTLETVHHPGGVGIIAVDAEQKLCLLRHYRHVVGQWLWEIPAGKIDNFEPPLDTARRELREEAGAVAQRLIPLGRTLSSPGVFTEVVYLYLAQELQIVPTAHEPEECIEVHWIELATVRDWIRSGEIVDAKTIVGVMLLGLQR